MKTKIFVLFNGERMSGAHAELYSYSFYFNNLKGYYYFAVGDDADERPCDFIDNWEYDPITTQ